MHRSRPLIALAAAMALGGLPQVAVPAPASASAIQGQQSKGILPTQRVSKRAIRAQFNYLGLGSEGPRAPWVNRHGYLLRQVSRPMPRSIR